MSNETALISNLVYSPTVAEPLTQVKEIPKRDGMILTNEAGLHHLNPPWTLVERVVREIDAGFGNSFCILEAADHNYIQVLRGFNGYHLEWRASRLGGHYRACYPGASSKATELKKHDCINSGEHRDFLQIEDVLDGFRSFYEKEEMTVWLEWRVLNL